MNWGKAGRITLAVVVYVVLTYVVLDGVLHWWAHAAFPVPDAVAISLWFLFTACFLWVVWRIVRKRA
jgi:hypothetical protein